MGRVPQVRSFPTREQAVERFLLVSGLTNLVDPIHPAVTAGIVEENGQFRLAADPLTTLSSGESIEAAIMSCRSRSFPFRLAGGENDPIAPFGDMRELDRQAVCFPACGHNAHVEKPVVVAQAYLRYRGLADS